MALRIGRALLLVLPAMTGTVAMMHLAPGYLSEAAAMDAQRGGQARARMETAAQGAWFADNFAVSRQFGFPVWDLVKPRLSATASLLARGVLFGWLIAFGAAAARRMGQMRLLGVLAFPFTLLLAVPVGALATLCLRLDRGGPVLVLTLIVAARDFKFLDRLIVTALQLPCFLQARAQGISVGRVLKTHLLPAVGPQMAALAVMSIVTALSALVPVEVLFDSPGIGQLAWTAAMNRDLPVLLAVTLILASVVALLSALGGHESNPELA